MTELLAQTMAKWSADGVCLASKPTAVQLKWKQERDEERLEFQPSVGRWNLVVARQPGSRRRR